MPLDLDAIRKKLAQVSGQNSRKNALWRPDEGKEYSVRILPYPDNEGQPFKERWFYYGVGPRGGVLTLKQFGQRDPVDELIQKLRDEGSKDSYDMAKTLYPKVRHYAPIIVRGEENKGVRLWAFGKDVCEELLTKMLDEDYGDITDVPEGNDIKVSVAKMPGQKWFKTKVDVRPKKSALTHDSAQIKAWLVAIPDLNTLYDTKTYEEIEKMLNDHLNGVTSDEGTFRGGSNSASRGTSEESASTSGLTDDSAQAEDKIDAIFDDLKADI